MKPGDFVRFAKWEELSTAHFTNTKGWPDAPKNYIGVLIHYDKLMGTAQVLCEGEFFDVRAVFVEKAGKKDFVCNRSD